MDKEDVVYIYNVIPLSHKKKKEMLPFATTWMDLEGVMLNEISQTEKNTVQYHLYMESKKYKLVNTTKKKQTHRYRKQTGGYQ